MSNDLVKFIKQLRKLWINIDTKQGKNTVAYYDWLLKEGETFDNIVIDKKRGKMKQCYYNSQSNTLDNKEIKYYEGYALSTLNMPFEHGFNVSNGKVIEKTWSDGRLYFGVNIPREFIINHWTKSGMAENLILLYFLKKTGRI